MKRNNIFRISVQGDVGQRGFLHFPYVGYFSRSWGYFQRSFSWRRVSREVNLFGYFSYMVKEKIVTWHDIQCGVGVGPRRMYGW